MDQRRLPPQKAAGDSSITLFARGFVSQDSLPAIFNQKDSWGTVTLLDSKSEGHEPGDRNPSILNQRQIALKNVTVTSSPKASITPTRDATKATLFLRA